MLVRAFLRLPGYTGSFNQGVRDGGRMLDVVGGNDCP